MGRVYFRKVVPVPELCTVSRPTGLISSCATHRSTIRSSISSVVHSRSQRTAFAWFLPGNFSPDRPSTLNASRSSGQYVSAMSTARFTCDYVKSPITLYFASGAPCCSLIQNLGGSVARRLPAFVTGVGFDSHPFSIQLGGAPSFRDEFDVLRSR